MITRQKIRTVQEKIQRAIAEIEKEEQVKISFGTRSFNNAEYSTKMTVKTVAKDKSTMKAVGSVNKVMSQSYGFDENIIGKQFTNGNGTHTIIEFKTRNRKYPIITECSNGGRYKLSVGQVKMYLR
jgi:hypothetical protein